MNNSIEERLLVLQEAKAALSKGVLSKLSEEEVRKTRVADLKNLFRINGVP